MKTVLALRHLAFEDLGLLRPLLERRGWRVRYHDIGVDDLEAVDLAQVDLLAALGGPIGAEDDAHYPFLANERRLIGARLASRRPLLGICLGAQLIAGALGARVRPMGHREIGFTPLELTAKGRRSPIAGLDGQPVLHWHGDRFDMPEGVASLARTGLCEHQAFSIAGGAAMGWQFHLEVDPARIEQWLVGHATELAAAGIDPQSLRDGARRHGASLCQALEDVMARWLHTLPP